VPEDAAEGARAPSIPTSEQILSSARRCFESAGIRKTTVEDIAAAAGISRQTVYKYFSSKQDIVDHIGMSEVKKVQATLRQRMTHHPRFADKMTEAIFVSVKVAKENPYVRRMIEELEVMPGIRSSTDAHYLWLRSQWDKFLNTARKSGELASDLDTDQIVPWLALSQTLLLIKMEHQLLPDGELRHFIRRFVVDPLLADRGAARGGSDEVASLRRHVAEQALEIRALRRR
jgi:AcrR family transcriptional regulator